MGIDEHERNLLAVAVAERIAENTKELVEKVAEWAISTRDEAKAWLWFLLTAVLLGALSATVGLKLSGYLCFLCFGASGVLFGWWVKRKARKKWQQREFARQHFRGLLECRQILQGMTELERMEVNANIVKWFLGDFFPGGDMHPMLWDGDEQEGILFPAIKRMRIESMGLTAKRDDAFAAEYAFKNYSELDPDFKWLILIKNRRKT